ncbi:MAG: Bor family protein [Gemmatimonadaceae bacterium]
MRLKLLALAAASVALTGCYHITVQTNAQPSPTVVDLPWQHSFIYGLVPPAEVNVKDRCPNGAQKVETEQSFLNGLVQGITWGIYTPIHVKVTCAAR